MGFAINLLSPHVGAMLAKSSLGVLSFWRKRPATLAAREQARIAELRASEYERVMAAVAAVHQEVGAVTGFVMAGALCTITQHPPVLVVMSTTPIRTVIHRGPDVAAVVVMTLSMGSLTRAYETRRLIRVARDTSGAENAPADGGLHALAAQLGARSAPDFG
ncbi:hypothetical protein [Myxococcus virescens]|uniref:hypothetical protein n=1 Tax=Myxococcus virescens TaxID=83456 RepID=UPI000B843BD3|nr:hypothetical protein [Myxococcus virescens]